MIFVQRNQRCSHDVHSAHQLVRAAVGKNLVNHQRLHLEGLRLAAPGKRKAAGDIVNQQAERLALLA